MERHPPLQRSAEATLRDLEYDNVTTLLADGRKGWDAQAPFHHILVSSADNEVIPVLLDQLKLGGTLIAPVEAGTGEQILQKQQKQAGQLEVEDLVPVRFAPMLPGLALDP